MAKTRPAGVVPSDGSVRLFNNILRAAYARIFATFEGNTLATNKRRKEAMAQIEAIANETGLNLQAWADVEIKAFYEMGMFEATKGLFDQGSIVRLDKAFVNFHREAIEALAQEGYSDIAKAMSGMVGSSQRLVTNAAKQAVLEKVATGQLLGEAREKIKKSVIKELKKNGIGSLVDKSGRNWELSRYGDMLARTKMTQAHNSGLINRMSESGYDLVQVSDHFGECELCRPWEGEILSIHGRSSKYPSLAKAESEGLFHPNCRHTFSPAHSDYADQSMVWDTTSQKYVPYSELASKRQIKKLESQKFKDILDQNNEIKKSLGLKGVAEFNKAIDSGDRIKAKSIASTLPQSNSVRKSMERLIGFI